MSVAEVLASEVSRSVSRRAGGISAKARKSIFTQHALLNHVWVRDTHAAILVGDRSAINEATKRERRFLDPFPRLVTTDSAEGAFANITAQQVGFARLTIDSGTAHAIRLAPDSSVYFNDVGVKNVIAQYVLPNVYLLGFGTSITSNNYADYFDDLLARQIIVARSYGLG